MSGRAAELAATYTAPELARQLADHETALAAERERSRARAAALQDIAGGGWTADGAIEVARKALRS